MPVRGMQNKEDGCKTVRARRIKWKGSEGGTKERSSELSASARNKGTIGGDLKVEGAMKAYQR